MLIRKAMLRKEFEFASFIDCINMERELKILGCSPTREPIRNFLLVTHSFEDMVGQMPKKLLILQSQL